MGDEEPANSTAPGAQNAERGLVEILTPLGLARYLALTAMLRDGVPQHFSDRSWASFSADNDVSSPSWNAYRDRYAYCGLLGEWAASGENEAPPGARQRLFGFDVPVLRIAQSPHETRHIVNETVRSEIEALDIAAPDGDKTLGDFLYACFCVLGHTITGSANAAYFRRLGAAQQACGASADPHLHALLRKQSVFLWDALSQHSARQRRTTMRSILSATDRMFR